MRFWLVVWGLLVLAGAAPGGTGAQELRSGYDDAGPQVRAMQDDDTANPAFLWVQQGAALWAQKAGVAGRSCADCHGAVEAGMRGVAARYPRMDAARGRPVTLEQRINLCRSEQQAAPVLPPESDALLGLAALVGLQSRGMPVAVDVAAGERHRAAGEAFFHLRQGQLNLSCAQCHDGLAGQSLAGSRIPQGHANAYPIYRLEWQGVGSLFRRLRACLVGVRAEPLGRDDPVLADLEFYLAWRAQGLRVETPGVRP